MAQAKERIYRLDDRNLDIIQAEGNKEKKHAKETKKMYVIIRYNQNK